MSIKKELIAHIGDRAVSRVRIEFERYGADEDVLLIEGRMDHVLAILDVTEALDLSGDMVGGYIWYEDGSWSVRKEHEGKTWWHCVERPQFAELSRF